MKTKHKQEVPKVPKDPTRFYCEICSNSYKLKQTLKSHKEKYHQQENTLQKSFQPTVPVNIVLTGILDTKVTGDSNPNILQNSQNDNFSQPLQEIAHNACSDIMPNIPQNDNISQPLQEIAHNPGRRGIMSNVSQNSQNGKISHLLQKIAHNQSLEKTPNTDEKDSMVHERKNMHNCTYCGKISISKVT